MKRYLQLTRAHTAPLEAVPAAVGGMIATGGVVTSGVLYWMMFGVFYHLAGYGHNSLRDWEKGYDKDDENKQHHPLNNGSLSPYKARVVIAVLMFTAIGMGVLGVLISGSYAAILFLIIGVVSGYVYNEFGKETPFKFVFISIAHSSVFAVPYLALHPHGVTFPFIMLWVVVFFWVMYQIAISGEVKDIHQDEANILKRMGYKYDSMWSNDITLSASAISTASLMRVVMGAFALGYIIHMDGGTVAIVAVVVITAISIKESVAMLSDYINERGQCLQIMSRIEFYSMAVFLAAASAVIGWETVIAILTISFVWVVAFNKYQWDTLLAPDV